MSESEGDSATSTDASRSPSPLVAKSKGKNVKNREIRQSVPDGPECLPLPSDYSEDDVTDTENDDGTEVFSLTTEDTDEEEEDEGEEEWVPPVAPTPKPRASNTNTSRFSSSSAGEPASVPLETAKGRSSKGKISKIAREMENMTLHAESDSDLSAYILPSRKVHQGPTAKPASDVENNKLATVKPKKRCGPKCIANHQRN